MVKIPGLSKARLSWQISAQYPLVSPFEGDAVLTFEPCQNTSCVSAREVLNIPVEDSSGRYLNMVYNYSLVPESLVLNSYYPENNIIDVNYEMGTIFIWDNDGKLNACPFPQIIL